jgi:hypothetical protein
MSISSLWDAALDDSVDRTTQCCSPSDDHDTCRPTRRPDYSQCASTGFAPPEKCFAPCRPRRLRAS